MPKWRNSLLKSAIRSPLKKKIAEKRKITRTTLAENGIEDRHRPFKFEIALGPKNEGSHSTDSHKDISKDHPMPMQIGFGSVAGR